MLFCYFRCVFFKYLSQSWCCHFQLAAGNCPRKALWDTYADAGMCENFSIRTVLFATCL